MHRRRSSATVVVEDKQLSLAIGKEGQNVRLAAKLTGWRIDIKSLSQICANVEEELFNDSAIENNQSNQEEPSPYDADGNFDPDLI